MTDVVWHMHLLVVLQAWFKLYLEGKESEFGIDYHAMIYGNSSQSLCGIGSVDGEKERCEVHR